MTNLSVTCGDVRHFTFFLYQREKKDTQVKFYHFDYVHGMHWYSQFRCYMYSISMFLVNQIFPVVKITLG
jgi:hypothetical protein